MPDRPRELRLVVTAADYDAALRFYRDTLGLTEQASGGDDDRYTILHAGRATLELGDPAHAELIDDLEVGRRVAGAVRVAFEVGDAEAVTARLADAGATVVAEPTRTPWGSLNARLDGPAGLHLTVYSNDIYVQQQARLDSAVLLAEPDPGWASTGASLVAAVRGALGDRASLVAHVGSTSVPRLAAKPVYDLVLTVDDPGAEDGYVPALEPLGYRLHLREPEWHEHRLLKHDDPAVNLHVFGAGSEEADRMLAFRDHLRADERDRLLYESTKRELAAREWAVTQDYADAKSDVVAEIMRRALDRPRRAEGLVVLVRDEPGAVTPDAARALAARLGLPLLAAEGVRAVLPTADRALLRTALVEMAVHAGGAVLTGVPEPDTSATVTRHPGRVVTVDASAFVDAEALARRLAHLVTA